MCIRRIGDRCASSDPSFIFSVDRKGVRSVEGVRKRSDIDRNIF